MGKRICTIYVIEEQCTGWGETDTNRDELPSLEWAKLELEERYKTYKRLAKHEIEWHEGEKLIAHISKDKDYFCVYDGCKQIVCSIKEKKVKRGFGF